jgi:hypothetical protein
MAVLTTASHGARIASNLGLTSTPFTFGVWLRRTAAHTQTSHLMCLNSTNGNHRQMIVCNSSNQLGMMFRHNNGTIHSDLYTTSAPGTNSWFPVVFRTTSNELRDFYLSSISNNRNNTTDIGGFQGHQEFTLGYYTGFIARWQGQMAHAAVWDTDLSNAQVTAFLAGGNPLAISAGNLVGYWAEDFYENSGSWYYEDKSGNGYDLLLQDAAARDTTTSPPAVDDPPSTGLAFTVAPAVTSRTTDSYTIGGTLGESGDVFAVAILPEATDPTTPAQIIAGMDGTDTAARGTGQQLGVTSFSFNITGGNLSANPTHDIFVVGRKQT